MRISDWSSDVCSSDLAQQRKQRGVLRDRHQRAVAVRPASRCEIEAEQLDFANEGFCHDQSFAAPESASASRREDAAGCDAELHRKGWHQVVEIGRASGRERVSQYV